MIKKLNKSSEFNHFKNLSNEWWDPYGKFNILHTLTPIRIKYIKGAFSNKNQNLKIHKNKPLKNLDILDLGCGGGLVCEPLARLGANLTGVDFIKENINIANKHAKISKLKIKYLHQNLDSIKLLKKYDAILLLEVLEHLDDWKQLIITVGKFLKPKGKLIISTINKTFLSKIFAIFVAENILKWVPKGTHNFNKLINHKKLISFLNGNDINVIDLTGLVFNPLTSEWKLNKNKLNINYFCTAIKSN